MSIELPGKVCWWVDEGGLECSLTEWNVSARFWPNGRSLKWGHGVDDKRRPGEERETTNLTLPMQRIPITNLTAPIQKVGA